MLDELPTNIPSYRRHKLSGLAVVRLNGHDVYLGKHGTAASRAEYRRVIAEWLACGRQVPVPESGNGPPVGEMTVNELFLAYYEFVKTYYVKNGRPTGEQSNILDACRPVTELYGTTCVKDFGPRGLKAVRESMVQHGLCRRVGVWPATVFDQVIGKGKGMGKSWYYRIGYCPLTVNQGCAIAKTLLFPGFRNTPEYHEIQSSRGLTREEKHAFVKSSERMTAQYIFMNHDYALLKWLQEHGTPPVRPFDEEDVRDEHPS